MLVHAFVSSRLDYCNSLLAGVSDELVNRLQSVLRSAARLVLRKRKFDPVSIDLCERLHWLPIRQRIQYKLGLLVYKCLHGLAPSYLSDLLALVSADPYSCHLQSAAHGDLTAPWTRTVRMGPCSFAVSGPKFWNSLAPELKHLNISLASFKSLLKTELFIRAYPDRYEILFLNPLFVLYNFENFLFSFKLAARELYGRSHNGVSIRERLTKWLLYCIVLYCIVFPSLQSMNIKYIQQLIEWVYVFLQPKKVGSKQFFFVGQVSS